MDVQLVKIELIKLLQETEKTSVTTYIKSIFVKEKKDWYNELPDFVKEGIEVGLEDIRKGRVVSLEEVKKKYGW